LKLKNIKLNSSFWKFIIIFFLIGLLTGIYLYYNLDNNYKLAINNQIINLPKLINSTKQNFILNHLIIISILIILSFTIIGIPFIIFYFFYESVSLGFLIGSILKWKATKGLIFMIPFIIINKLIYYLLLIYIIKISINYSKKIINNYHNDKSNIIVRHLIKMAIVLIIILIVDIFIYFFGNKLLSIFLFLL
jgi:hypothetical protein